MTTDIMKQYATELADIDKAIAAGADARWTGVATSLRGTVPRNDLWANPRSLGLRAHVDAIATSVAVSLVTPAPRIARQAVDQESCGPARFTT